MGGNEMLRKFLAAAMIIGLGLIPVAASAADDSVRSTADSVREAARDTSRSATRGISDSWITLKTKMALLADKQVDSRNVHVVTDRGVVTLRGHVESEEARNAAADDARQIDGVKQVNNELTVVPKTARNVPNG